MIKLRTLVILQLLFATASISYLFINVWREHMTVKPLSPAPIVFSLILFGLYIMSLFLAKLHQTVWYRVAMGFAILFFGVGGVIGNIVRYMDSGLEDYSSFTALVAAVAINAFGSVLNGIAVLGLFRENKEVTS